jgi:hypothetical protein
MPVPPDKSPHAQSSSDASAGVSPDIFGTLITHFLASYVPGVVRARFVPRGHSLSSAILYVDVAAEHDTAFVSHEIQIVMARRFSIPLPPHQIRLREANEPQQREAAEQMQREHPDLDVRDATPEIDALLAAHAAVTDEGGKPFDFQRLRAEVWYNLRDGYIGLEGDASRTVEDRADDEDVRVQLVAHPVVRDVLVASIIDTIDAHIIAPAREDGSDLALLQDQLLAQWLVLAAERLSLPSAPFDDEPPEVAQAIAAAALAERDDTEHTRSVTLNLVSPGERYANATITQKRSVMRDSVYFMVTLDDTVLQQCYADHIDPLAAEAALLVTWLRLAASRGGTPPSVVARAFPIRGEPLDALMLRTGAALERLCIDRGLIDT